MSVGTQQYFVSHSTQAAALDAASRGADARTSPALRYSSLRPWLLAGSISAVMWAGMIWTVWRIF